MKKRTLLINLIILSLILFLSGNVFAQWDTSTSEDQMTGEKTCYATSSSVNSTEPMGFPYSDTKAWIGIGTDGSDEWVYIGFSESPNLTDTSIQDGYDKINTRIKWNEDEIEEKGLTQKWGSKFIHFQDNDYIISKIESSNTLLIELNWYGEDTVYYSFSLDGSAAAINEIRKEFE